VFTGSGTQDYKNVLAKMRKINNLGKHGSDDKITQLYLAGKPTPNGNICS